MIWREIFLDKNISKDKLINAFCLIFNISLDKVSLIYNIIDFGDNYTLTCVIDFLPGSFCLKLDCYPNFKIEDEFKIIARLCKTLDCQALIVNDEDEDRDSPYSFILFETSGQLKKVEVDPELFDEHDEIKIIHEMPFRNS